LLESIQVGATLLKQPEVVVMLLAIYAISATVAGVARF